MTQTPGGLWLLKPTDAGYPTHSMACLEPWRPDALCFLGLRVLWFERRAPWLGLAASVRCPGEAILATYDIAVALREAGVTVIGGFHSPMERETLHLLLRGRQAVVLCPARGLQGMRIKPGLREPLASGRLLLLSPFAASVRRPTRETATLRNRMVAALADALLVVHAQPDSKTEALACEALAWGRKVYTLDLPTNGHLLESGVGVFDLDTWSTQV